MGSQSERWCVSQRVLLSGRAFASPLTQLPLRVMFDHLVLGKAVQIRHYPVTVIAETWTDSAPATGSHSWEGWFKVEEA
jgi:hypothetical protein